MNKNNYIPWIVLMLGIGAWGGVYYYWYTVQVSLDSYTKSVHSNLEISNNAGVSARLHGVYRDTEADRATLYEIMNFDPLKITTLIAQAAQQAQVTIDISNPTAENASTISKDIVIQKFGFVANTRGTFSEVMRALTVLETLPAAVSIDTIDISLDSSGIKNKTTTHLWQMNAHLQIFITNNTGS